MVWKEAEELAVAQELIWVCKIAHILWRTAIKIDTQAKSPTNLHHAGSIPWLVKIIM